MTAVFDSEFESDIVATAMRDSDYLRKASPILEGHHLSTPEHTWVWEQMKTHHVKFRERITTGHLVARAKADFPDEDDLRGVLEFVRKLARRPVEAPKASLEELERFTRAVNIQAIMEEGAKYLEKGEYEKAYEAIDKAKHAKRAREYQMVRWIEEFDARQAERKTLKEHPELLRHVPTGFKKLDRIVRGVQPGELALWLAVTGVGKSISMANLAYNAAKAKKKTAIFSLEMPANQYASRIDARWLGMSYRKMKHYEFSADELRDIDRRLTMGKRLFKDMIRVVAMPLRAANMDWITGTLDDLAEDGFKCDQVIVDSGDHLKARRKYDGNYRLEQAEVYWDMKAMALQYDCAVWSTTQAGKEWKGRKPTAEAASESYDKARIADMIVSLSEPSKAKRSTRDDDDDDDEGESEVAEPVVKLKSPESKILELLLAKYRDGESGITIEMEADFGRMLLHDLDAPSEAEVAEVSE